MTTTSICQICNQSLSASEKVSIPHAKVHSVHKTCLERFRDGDHCFLNDCESLINRCYICSECETKEDPVEPFCSNMHAFHSDCIRSIFAAGSAVCPICQGASIYTGQAKVAQLVKNSDSEFYDLYVNFRFAEEEIMDSIRLGINKIVRSAQPDSSMNIDDLFANEQIEQLFYFVDHNQCDQLLEYIDSLDRFSHDQRTKLKEFFSSNFFNEQKCRSRGCVIL